MPQLWPRAQTPGHPRVGQVLCASQKKRGAGRWALLTGCRDAGMTSWSPNVDPKPSWLEVGCPLLPARAETLDFPENGWGHLAGQLEPEAGPRAILSKGSVSTSADQCLDSSSSQCGAGQNADWLEPWVGPSALPARGRVTTPAGWRQVKTPSHPGRGRVAALAGRSWGRSPGPSCQGAWSLTASCSWDPGYSYHGAGSHAGHLELGAGPWLHSARGKVCRLQRWNPGPPGRGVGRLVTAPAGRNQEWDPRPSWQEPGLLHRPIGAGVKTPVVFAGD